MADILSQEEIDKLLDFSIDSVSSEFLESFIAKFIASLESSLSQTEITSSHFFRILESDSFIDLPFCFIELSVNDSARLLFAIPTYLATAILDISRGGIGNCSDSINNDDLLLVKNIFINVLESVSAEFSEIDFKIENIFFNPNNNRLELSDFAITVFYELKNSFFNSTVLLIVDNNAKEILEISISEEEKPLALLAVDLLDLSANITPKENLLGSLSVLHYASLDDITKNIEINETGDIYEFDNGNIIIVSQYFVNIYSADGELIQEIFQGTFIGIHENRLYLLVDSEMFIYDENLNVEDSYMIWMIDKFKNPTFFNNKIITSENTIERDGILAIENSYIDSHINVWNRGKIEKTITAHSFGASCYQLDKYLVTFGLDGNNIWDEDLHLLGNNKDIQAFEMLDESYAKVDNTVLDFNLLLSVDEDDTYIESQNINNDMGIVIGDRVITCGFKTIYLWDKLSYKPLKQYNFEEQVRDLVKFETMLLVKTLEEKSQERVYYLFDLSLNILFKFELPDCYSIDLLKDSNKIVLNATNNSWFSTFISGEYFIVDINEKKIVKKHYEQKTYFYSVGLEKYLASYIVKDKIYIEYFNKAGELISKDSYQNDAFLQYPHSLGIQHHNDGSKDIFWYETSNHNGVGNIVFACVEQNILRLELLKYDYSKLRVNGDEWGSTPKVPSLKDFKIEDTNYIFSNGEIEFIFNDEKTYQGENILQLYKDIENKELYKIEDKEISTEWGSIVSDNERRLLTYEGKLIIEKNDNYLIINDKGRIKYLSAPEVKNYSKSIKSLKSKIAVITNKGSSGSVIKLVPSHRMDLFQSISG